MTEVLPVAFLKGPVHPFSWGAVRPECVCRPPAKAGPRAAECPFVDPFADRALSCALTGGLA